MQFVSTNPYAGENWKSEKRKEEAEKYDYIVVRWYNCSNNKFDFLLKLLKNLGNTATLLCLIFTIRPAV